MDVIIVGAGIAGLSAGIALRRAGHNVTILEQSSLLQETGAAITIPPNASRLLQSWDFDPVRSRMVTIKIGRLFDGTTMEVVVPNYYPDVEKIYGIPLYTVHRVDLHDQLKLLATQKNGPGHPVNIQVRARVIDYDAIHGIVVLTNGRALQADLIVAADGVHSTAVTNVVEKEEMQAKDTGWATMRWLVPTEDLLSDPDTASFPVVKEGVQGYYIGAQGRGAISWYPCRDKEVQNFLFLSRSFDNLAATEDFRAGIEPSVLLGHAEKAFGPALQPVIRKAKDVKFWKLVAREPLPVWHKGRLVLVGDAAHPMLPFQAQGAGQAIEDGAALGVLFDQLQDKEAIEGRLQLFEQVRRNRGSSLQVLSNSSHPAPQSVRDAAVKYLPAGKRLESTDDVNDYLFSYDVIKECKVVLGYE